MKKKLLSCALLAGMSLAQSAMAQSYDDRFYITAGVGAGFFDNNRDVNDDFAPDLLAEATPDERSLLL